MCCMLVTSAVLDGQLSMRAVELDFPPNASTPQRAMMMLSAGTCTRSFAGKLIATMQHENVVYIRLRNKVDIWIRVIL